MNVKKLCCPLLFSILLLAGPLAGQAGADPIPADFDGDGDVDLADFAEFQTCVLGPDFPQTDPACTGARLDPDPDVDLDDFGVFVGCLGGPGIPADPNCACASGETSCEGTCTSTASDNANCGECGNVCGAGLTCHNGSCVSCPATLTLCFGTCRDLQNDPTFCGTTCENAVVCSQYETCTGGACVPVD
jgi:hypothetical protein